MRKGIVLKSLLLVLLVILLLFALVSLVGCTEAGYNHKIYDPTSHKLLSEINVSHRMLNVTETTGNAIIKLADGTVIILVDNKVIADPNSAKAEAELVTAVGGLFSPIGMLKEVVK